MRSEHNGARKQGNLIIRLDWLLQPPASKQPCDGGGGWRQWKVKPPLSDGAPAGGDGIEGIGGLMVWRKRHQRQEREKQRERTRRPSEATAGSGEASQGVCKVLTLMQLHASFSGEITCRVSRVESRVRRRMESFKKSGFNPARTPPL